MKTSIKEAISIILAIVMVFAAVPLACFVGLELPSLTEIFAINAEASSYTSGLFTYTVSGSNATITDCDTSAAGAIVVPETIDGYTVTTIGNYAFQGCTEITSVDLGNITTLGYGIFKGCKSLTEITFPNTYTTTTHSYNSYGPLAGSNITNVVFEDGIKNIPEYACYNGTYIKNVTLCEYDDYDTNGYVIGKYAFANTAIETITLPETITQIYHHAFQGCTLLADINITDNVTSICEDAFSGCSSIKNVTIGRRVAIIGDQAFNGCSSITKITIPESVKTIGDEVFKGCHNLENIAISENITNIGRHVFNDTAYYRNEENWKEEALYLGTKYLVAVKEDYSGEFEIKDGTEVVCGGAFFWHENIAAITIPNTVKTLGSGAFCGCTSLTSIVVPDSVTVMDRSVFTGCKSLTNVKLSKNITSIEGATFNGCTNLTNIVIPEGVVQIGIYAFDLCTNLKTITIPKSLKFVDQLAFIQIENLEFLNYNGTSHDWYSINIHPTNEILIELYEKNYGKETNYIIPFDYLDRCYDNFIYIASEVYEENGELTDYMVKRGDKLEFRYYIKSDLNIGLSKIYTLFDNSFFDVRVLTDNPISKEPDGYEWLNENGIFNENHPSVSETDIHTISSGSFSEHTSTRFSTLDTDYISAKNHVENYIKRNYDNDVPFEMTSDEWFISFFVTVKDDVVEGQNGAIESPVQIWQAYYNEEIERYDPRMPGNINASTENDENGKPIYKNLSYSMTNGIVENFIINDLNHEFTVYEPHSHYYSEKITDEPTCENTGTKIYECICGDSYFETIPKTGHKPDEWEIVTEATEESDGIKVKKCTVCGAETDKEVIPKHMTLKDSESGTEIVYPPDEYEGEITVVVEEKRDSTAFNLVNAQNPVAEVKVYDIKMMIDGKEIQPATTVTVRIPLPEGFNPEHSYVCHINTETKKVENMNATVEAINGKLYFVFETTHFSYYAVVENADFEMSVRTPSVTEIKYGDSIWLHAEISGELPADAKIIWTSSNNNFEIVEVSPDGLSCRITPKSNGSTTFTVSVVNTGEKVLSSDTHNMTSKAGFFDKIIAFFKKLFGLTKVIQQSFDSTY